MSRTSSSGVTIPRGKNPKGQVGTVNVLSLALVAASILLTSGAQILLKAGTNALKAPPAVDEPLGLVWRLATQPFIVGGLVCYVLSFGVWILVLSRLPVSIAYPLLALGYIVTALLGFALFGEQLGWIKISGILVIILGVVILTAFGR